MSMIYKFKDDSLQQRYKQISGMDLSVLTPVISPQGKLENDYHS